MRPLGPAARTWLVALLALLLASLLNAQGLRKTAQGQPEGVRRDVSIALARPLAAVSHFLYLDRPRQELMTALGRGDEDRIDTRVLIPTTPPARPRRGPVVVQVHPPAQPRHRGRPRPAPPPSRPAFSPRRPLTVWFAGDSLAQVPGESLERAVGPRSAIRLFAVESRVSTGLGRPDVYNWYTRFRDVIAQQRPRVAVLSLGSNDGHDYLSGVPDGVSVGGLGSPSWDAEYRRRLVGVTEEFARAGAHVIWIGLPITRGEGRNSGFRVVNRIMRSVVAAHPKTATFVDTWHLLATSQGRYADYLRDAHGRLVQMRSSDGVHFTPAAGDLIARSVLRRLNQLYDLTSWSRRATDRRS
jgi:hypothetical protein